MASDKTQSYKPEQVVTYVEQLESSSRRTRQEAAHEISLIAEVQPELLESSLDELIDALYRPEAQTRWEIMNALTHLGTIDGDNAKKAVEAAESSLFDELSSSLHLASFRLLATLGATSPENSDRVWSLLEEAVLCYHGEPEFREMLITLLDFAQGNLSQATKTKLHDRIAFDANNGEGYMRSYAKQIADALS